LTQPHPDGEAALAAMQAAGAAAGVTPDDVDYVNAHGTATRYNDPIETKAIKDVLGERAFTVPVNSIKSPPDLLMTAIMDEKYFVSCFRRLAAPSRPFAELASMSLVKPARSVNIIEPCCHSVFTSPGLGLLIEICGEV